MNAPIIINSHEFKSSACLVDWGPSCPNAIFHFEQIVFDWNDVSPGIGSRSFLTFGRPVGRPTSHSTIGAPLHMFQYTSYGIWAHRRHTWHMCRHWMHRVIRIELCVCVRGGGRRTVRRRWISCELQTCGKYKMKLKAITLRVWRDVAQMRTTINLVQCALIYFFPFSQFTFDCDEMNCTNSEMH